MMRTTLLLLASTGIGAAWSAQGTGCPEIGENDFQLSDMGPTGDAAFDADSPAVAAGNGCYLVAWTGENGAPWAEGELEIFARLVDGTTGTAGATQVISDMGPLGNADYSGSDPAVAYDPDRDRFLVVWVGSDNTKPLVLDEFEIFGRFVDNAGTPVGAQFRISNTGKDGMGTGGGDAKRPDVVYAPFAGPAGEGAFLAVWSGDQVNPNNKFEISGQWIDASDGAEIGMDFQISQTGPSNDASYAAFEPAVACALETEELLVVWRADNDELPLVDDDFEIFAHRLDADGLIGTTYRLSDTGPVGEPGWGAYDPDVIYDHLADRYLVVWSGDDAPVEGLDEPEIFGRFLDASGAPLGLSTRISDQETGGDPVVGAVKPSVAWDPVGGSFLVTWSSGDDTVPPAIFTDEREVFGRVLHADVDLGSASTAEARLSDMGPDGNAAFDAVRPAAAFAGSDSIALVVWSGDDDSAPLVEGEMEIFGQRVLACATAQPSLEVVRLGTPPNPDALRPGATSGPIVGCVWDPYLDHETFLPGALVDLIGITGGAANANLGALGTLLCDPAGPMLLLAGDPGAPFDIVIPPHCTFAGASFCAQGASLDATSARLTNALDITLGTL